MISKFFIDRPVLANVLAIVIVLIGGVAAFTLPIAQYPNIVPPTVQVTTNYPGAIGLDRRQPGRAAGRAAGQRRRRHDLHAVDQHRHRHLHAHRHLRDRHRPRFRAGAGAEPGERRARLAAAGGAGAGPDGAEEVDLDPRDRVAVSPDGRYDSLYLSNYATINLVNELSRVPGVGNVNVLGVGKYSMRIWLDPQKLYTYGLTASRRDQGRSSRRASR